MLHKNFGKGTKEIAKQPVNDKVYTPDTLAQKIIGLYKINGSIYDPFRGGGAFYNNYPESNKKYWSELDEGKDFFEFEKKVEWIISNPPYSIYNEVMEHSFKIAKNIVYLVPLSKVVSSLKRMRDISNYGGVKSIYYFSASKANFPFGFPCVAIHFKKGYKGKTKIEELEYQKPKRRVK